MLECLESIFEAQSEAPNVTNVVLDGAATVQMLKPGAAKTFEEYAHQVFLPYISGLLRHVSHLDLVGQLRSQLSHCGSQSKTKERSMPMRHCICTHTEKLAQLPTCGPQQAGTLQLPLKAIIQSFDEDNKELVVTDGEQVLCVPPQQDIYSLAPFSLAEADTRMWLHRSTCCTTWP